MYLEISNPMDYHVALYIRLSKEDENEGPSEKRQQPEILLMILWKKHDCRFVTLISMTVGRHQF